MYVFVVETGGVGEVNNRFLLFLFSPLNTWISDKQAVENMLRKRERFDMIKVTTDHIHRQQI